MRKWTLIILVIVFSLHTTFAQESKFQLGINVGNHLSFANYDTYYNDLSGSPLLRYSAGILARYKLKTNIKIKQFNWIPPTKKGTVALDIGANWVKTGYDYSFRGIHAFQEQTQYEFPMMITLWDERSPFLTRKMHRQGNAFYSRVGFKPSVLVNGTVDKTIVGDEGSLSEISSFGGFNLFAAFAIGLLKKSKKDHSTAVELTGNFGLFRTTEGTITYQAFNQPTERFDFNSRGHYIALKAIYLLKSDIYIRQPAKVIYHPRYFHL